MKQRSDTPLQYYNRADIQTGWAFLLPVVVIAVGFILIPVIGSLYTSLFKDVSYLPRSFVGLRNYMTLLQQPGFWHVVRFTLLFTLVAVALEAFFGMVFALILNERFPLRGILRAVILIPWAIPTIVSGKIWSLIFNYTYGILNVALVYLGIADDKINWLGSPEAAFWSLIIAEVWKTTPFVVIILLAGLQAIPEELFRQARVDGAGLWGRFYRIIFPQLLPVFIIALIFRTIDSLRVFDLIYVLTGGGPGSATKSLSILGFEYFSNDRFGIGSAVSILTFIIAFSATLVYLYAGKFNRRLQE